MILEKIFSIRESRSSKSWTNMESLVLELGHTNGFFELLDCQEGENEDLLRRQGAPIGQYEALLYSELVD